MHLFNRLFYFFRSFLFIVLFTTLSAISCTCGNPSCIARKTHKPKNDPERTYPKPPGKQHKPKHNPNPVPPETEKEKKERERNGYELYRRGLEYFEDIKTEKDKNTAFKFFQQAAKKQCADAQYMLGLMYYSSMDHGNGMYQNDKQVVEGLKRAAEQGHQKAQHLLALIYQKTRHHPNGFQKGTVTLDDRVAFKWYKKAAEQGCWSSQFALNWMYKAGIGVEKNLTEAKKWCQIASIDKSKPLIEILPNNQDPRKK